jgi:hypothetical protein
LNWTFDWNEMFMILTTIIASLFAFIIRKHFQKIVLFLVWIFTVAFVETLDYSLAGSPFRVYYCADNTTYEPATAIIHLFLYPAFSVIFLFYYDKWNIHGKKLIIYILFWDVFSIFFEWIYVLNGVFIYTGWKLYYSILIYPISNVIIIKFYHFIKKQLLKPIQN